ncbi:hypothetical protein EG327_006107 [Venturia inaequalis]|uniref:Apple domain-containing protein n=1 Tax=Venturia inaequalis TaxID=5025 RepID=A0A8H3V3Z1_VENIN|nr:hypothetical protein EG327_006107 [Venturia inaequalis]
MSAGWNAIQIMGLAHVAPGTGCVAQARSIADVVMDHAIVNATNVLGHVETNVVEKILTTLCANKVNVALQEDGVEPPTIIARSKMAVRGAANLRVLVQIVAVLKLVAGFCGTSHAHCDKNQGCQSGCDDPEPPPRRPDTQTPLIPTRPPPKKTRDDEDPDSPTKPPPKKTRDDEDPDSPTKPPPKRIRDDEDPDPPTRPPPKKTRDDEDPDSPSKPPPKRTRDDEDPDSPTKPPPKKTRDDEDPDSPTRPPPKKTRDDEDLDSPTRPPPKKTRDDEDPDSPSKPPPKKTRDDEDCPKCPACPKTECPPPPKKNPSSVPKFHDSTANTVLSCLCDEGEEPTAHKLAPQKLGCNWKHGQQIHIRGRCYQYECFTWQASGVHEKVPGDSLEHCGELCVADKRCWSINFFHEHPATGGKPACSLHVGASEPSEYPVKQGNWVYGGSLKKC